MDITTPDTTAFFGFQRYGGPEVLKHLTVPTPRPGPGQVLIRMTAAGVNPADIKVRNGDRQGSIPVQFPMAVGREAAGVVVELGEGVGHVSVGDRVFGPTAAGTGALAGHVLLDAPGVAAVPDGVTDEQAACIPVAGGTAHDALDELDLAEGSTVLMLGAGGGVGTCVLQMARDRGLTVLGLASAQKAELIESLGGIPVDRHQDWETAVRRQGSHGSHGVDAVIDSVGGETLRSAAALLRIPGAIRSVADPAQAEQLGGSGVIRRRTTEVYTQVAQLVADGRFAPVITQRFALADAAQAVAAVESGHAAGKVVVTAD